MSIEKTRQRNYALDFAKGIACILVVFMHCEFPWVFGILIQSVSRFCVPFFFMVSGYFCYDPNKPTDYGRKIKHIAITTLLLTALYFILTPIYSTSKFEITLPRVVDWVVFNRPFYIASQLWFLYALLYDYIIFALVEKFGLRRIAYFAMFALAGAYILLAQGAHIAHISVDKLYYRNFLVLGFPFFTFGFYLHEKQDGINISNTALIAALIISTVLCPVERLVLGRDFGVNIVSFVQVAALFVLCIKNPSFGNDKNHIYIYKLGKDYSMLVYFFHPAIWHLLDKLYKAIGIYGKTAFMYVRPVILVFVTILAAIVYLAVKNLIFNKNKARNA
ncbi:MAG: acyltransferase [Clostridia bacterium]|nr:acyltransferase [Clostridia bacterium]